jgi:hypothetical protein
MYRASYCNMEMNQQDAHLCILLVHFHTVLLCYEINNFML